MGITNRTDAIVRIYKAGKFNQKPMGKIHQDQRVSFPHNGGRGFIINHSLCIKLGIDPLEAIKGNSDPQVYHRVGVNPDGTEIRFDYPSEPKKFSLNPEWKQYNEAINEGGDGYNPHQKYLN